MIDYERDGRLGDVVALIQLLAVHEWSVRSEKGVKADLRGDPRSGVDRWLDVAKAHPEFFRVLPSDPATNGDRNEQNRMSLVVRHASERGTETRERVSEPLLQALLTTAIELHKDATARQTSRAKIRSTLIAAIIGALGGGAVAILLMGS